VPIKKLGNGYYIFGTRKIYAKILNGKLVIKSRRRIHGDRRVH